MNIDLDTLSDALSTFPKHWDGRTSILTMKDDNYPHWRQMEWIGFYFQYLCDNILASIGMKTPGNKYGRTDFDGFWKIDWDFKSHPIHNKDGKESTTLIANDLEATTKTIEQFGCTGLIVACGEASFDNPDTMPFREYSVFIEKISQQAQRSVIITPQSFLGGAKFSTLRFAMARNGGGEIYSFDNVPSPLFCGRKKGVFNSNTSNSVRAAITLIDKNKHGFRLSPMIRFKSEERIKLFSDIESLLGEKIYTQPYVWTKIPKTLEELVDAMNALPYKVSDFIEKDKTKQDEKLRLTIPQTPRYFISATSRDLNRTSKIVIYAKDEASFYKLYLLINSSFSYLWWRIYDGGITLGKSTLLSLPVPDIDDDEKLNNMVKTYIGLEDSFLVNKLNAGKNNENVKFPPKYRSKLNQYLLNYFGLEGKSEQLLSIHSNTFTDYSKYWR